MSSTIKIKAPEPMKFSLLRAAINCEHHITGSVIRLGHDPEAPGHNALNQLGNRLDAEMREQLAARDAQWQEMVGQLLEIAERAKRLVEHADFKLGGILSNATSSVKARHLASLRDSLAALSSITE